MFGCYVLVIGYFLLGNEVMVVDVDGKFVEDGMYGEFFIVGGQLVDGYLNVFDLIGQCFLFIEGKCWYWMGDLVLWDVNGRFYCLGCIDNQVKVLGYCVEFEEIDVYFCVVLGIDLVGFVVWLLVDGMVCGIVSFVGVFGFSVEQVIDVMKSWVLFYMVFNCVVVLVEMLFNISGKVD